MPEMIQTKIPAKTLTWFNLSGAVFDVVYNTCVFVGDLTLCLQMEFENDRYYSIEL